MKQITKGAITAIATTGLILSIPNCCLAIAQAPAQTTLLDGAVAGDAARGEIELLPNPVWKSNQKEETAIQAFAVQNSQNEKIEDLTQSRLRREKEEKIRMEKLRKQRIAREKAKQEAKRKKEIQACCGVAVGTKDQQILERIVEAEAGGEDFHGKLLVANVILNRVKSKSFPQTIEKVVFAHSGSRYQFSPIYDGRYYRVCVSGSTKKAVRAALQGTDPSEGALYFMERSSADCSNVSWFDTEIGRAHV